jgi:putative methyltransferase (TIGR04325 family)
MARPDAVWNAAEGPSTTRAPRLKNPLKWLRIAIARTLARLLKLVSLRPAGCRAVQAVRKTPILGPFVQALLAFNRPFPNLEAGEVYIRRYISEGHEHPHQYYAHLGFAEITRESDYAVLYHLAPIASQLRSVFDLGGSIGNVFYAYDRRLHFSPDLRWTIKELAVKKQQMLDFARSKGEARIAFTEEFSDASGVDLFIVTGALPFFEEKLATMLGRLAVLPQIVVVDRTPFSAKGDFITAQDAGLWAHPFKLHDVETFLSGMVSLGYELVDRWPVHERKFLVPLYPELNDHYWGFLFRLKGSDTFRPTVAKLISAANA